MSRNPIDYEERRDEILTTARELFLSRGYETTTIQETIDAVGIAKSTFYPGPAGCTDPDHTPGSGGGFL